MKTNLRGRHFITDQEWSNEELWMAWDLAFELKMKFALGQKTKLLEDKTLFMIFFDNSTRTRNSFEAGMTQLGGHAHFLTPNVMQISHGENAKDTGTILSSYGHGIAVRHCAYKQGNPYIREIAKYSRGPVINMQCDEYHPCQVLADYMTIVEKFGRNTKGLKIGVSWTSAPNYVRPLSVPVSLALLMPRMGIDTVLAYPPEFKLQPQFEKLAAENAKEYGSNFKISYEQEDAFRGCDIVIPKSWGPLVHMEEKNLDQKAGLDLIKKYPTWKATTKMMDLTNKHSIYMHPLPADRGYEVEEAVIDGPHSVVYDEAENRLHVQKAIMALTMA
ncbi:MAG: ornithine carbamoyltransferase [Candidatus Riflebacteria bacterium]|nr:ornithine carbamoyltransferase [Candidatus Riflebacteria bacterium]